jgi:hypothetical protein
MRRFSTAPVLSISLTAKGAVAEGVQCLSAANGHCFASQGPRPSEDCCECKSSMHVDSASQQLDRSSRHSSTRPVY